MCLISKEIATLYGDHRYRIDNIGRHSGRRIVLCSIITITLRGNTVRRRTIQRRIVIRYKLFWRILNASAHPSPPPTMGKTDGKLSETNNAELTFEKKEGPGFPGPLWFQTYMLVSTISNSRNWIASSVYCVLRAFRNTSSPT